MISLGDKVNVRLKKDGLLIKTNSSDGILVPAIVVGIFSDFFYRSSKTRLYAFCRSKNNTTKRL